MPLNKEHLDDFDKETKALSDEVKTLASVLRIEYEAEESIQNLTRELGL